MRRLFASEPAPKLTRQRRGCDHRYWLPVKPDPAVDERVRYCRECGSRSDDHGQTWTADPEAE